MLVQAHALGPGGRGPNCAETCKALALENPWRVLGDSWSREIVRNAQLHIPFLWPWPGEAVSFVKAGIDRSERHVKKCRTYMNICDM